MKAYTESQRLQQSYVDKVLWAIAQRTPITWEAVASRFGVSRATAFRWRRPLEDARQRAQLMDIPRAAGRRTPLAADTEARTQ